MVKSFFEERTILSFESRLSEETAALIEKYGGRAVSAPSMQEIPLDEHAAVFSFAEALVDGEIDVLICLTGVGTRMMIETMLTRYDRSEVISSLSRAVTVSRGPKPAVALKEYGLKPAVRVPEPNTWKELLETIDTSPLLHPLNGKRVAVQEYGTSNDELLAELRARGAHVDQVAIYRWALPDDTEPLKAGIRSLLADEIDAVLFTSRTQIDHVMQLAKELGLEDAMRAAFYRTFVASIGPVCSEGLREHGIEPDFEPQRPKLGVMMRELSLIRLLPPRLP